MKTIARIKPRKYTGNEETHTHTHRAVNDTKEIVDEMTEDTARTETMTPHMWYTRTHNQFLTNK